MKHAMALLRRRALPRAWLALPALLALLMLAPRGLSIAVTQGVDAPAAAPAAGAFAAPAPADDHARVRMLAGTGSPSLAAAARDWAGFAGRGMLALLAVPLVIWLLRRPAVVNRIAAPGFEVVSSSERRQFIPLEERYQSLDFVTRIQTDKSLRLSANLNKVTLSARRYGYLMEDKNYRNALLVNRRRVRRTLLREGDVLDLGDLTLLYRDNRAAPIVRYSSITPADGKAQIKFERLNGPIRKGMPMLVPEQTPSRIFYVSKNKIFIGRSENNDLVIKSRNVYYRHAKLERVGGRWKLQDLSVLGNTSVNNRRVEQRFLKEGDEIAIESHRFKFGYVTRAMRERPPQPGQSAEEMDEAAPDAMAGLDAVDAGDASDDGDLAPSP